MSGVAEREEKCGALGVGRTSSHGHASDFSASDAPAFSTRAETILQAAIRQPLS